VKHRHLAGIVGPAAVSAYRRSHGRRADAAGWAVIAARTHTIRVHFRHIAWALILAGLVLFLNGIPIVTHELKSDYSFVRLLARDSRARYNRRCTNPVRAYLPISDILLLPSQLWGCGMPPTARLAHIVILSACVLGCAMPLALAQQVRGTPGAPNALAFPSC
jgi:hypothetical protein